MSKNKSYVVPFAIITILFFLWGFITVFVDSLVPRLKDVFELSYFQAGLVQFAFFGAYGLLSIPSGYQKGMVLGLVTMAIGCLLFFPASSIRVFPLFMLAYFTVAAGMTILQVSANPYISALGPESSASSRLNLSQAINSLGTMIAPLLGAVLLLKETVKTSGEIEVLDDVAKEAYYASEASFVQTPFIVLGVIILALAGFFFVVKLPKLLENSERKGFAEYGKAIAFPQLKWGTIGIFVYVGAEVAIGTYLVNYFLDMNMAEMIKNNEFMAGIIGGDTSGIDDKAIVAGFVAFYWSGAFIGRLVGAVLTRIFQPSKVLATFAIGAIVMILISIGTTGFVSMWAILAVGLFNSIMFPTIFTLAIEGLGDLKPQGSGLLCTAIVGGAVIPPLYGLCTDAVGFKMAFLLVILCYGYILWYGWSRRNSLTSNEQDDFNNKNPDILDDLLAK
jgi:FHS family L-fucose permease-like MFS transporter